MNRRGFIKAGLVGGAVATLPTRAFASPIDISPEHRVIVDRAKQELSRVGSQIWRTDKVGIVDFNRPSREPRFFIVDLEQGSVRSYLTAHGRGSDWEHDGWLKTFSNVHGSNATSRGAYMSLEWYTGKYGMSMRLAGLDEDNNNALDRAIVVHEAWYCAPDMLEKWGKLGRSEGCFAVPPGQMIDMLYDLGGGRLIFADRL